jgi:predicted CXXCH cytochrome family protein
MRRWLRVRCQAEPVLAPMGIEPASAVGFGAPCPVLVPRRGRVRRALILMLVGGLAITFVAGCTPVARYKVLTFFFTGVPPMGEEEKEEEFKPVVAKVVKKQSVLVKATRFTHGPYAANECYQCHEVSGSGGFRGFGKKEEAAGSIAKAGIVPGKMVAPMGELCGGCHDSKSPAKAEKAGLWVHGPVSTGYCVFCHGPHAGPEPYMLLKPADALCVECHAAGLVFSPAVHKDRKDCTACHNPHLGKDSRLLKADYRELW